MIRKKSLILRWKTNGMVMKRLFLLWVLVSVALCGWGQTYVVRMETNRGVIRMELSDLTPLHRDNFVKNVREGFYDGLLFHRVIANFMVQAGDQTTREKGVKRKAVEHYTVPAEFHVPELFCCRGAVAMAREDAAQNPELASSGHQFFIVWGKQWSERQVRKYHARTLEQTGKEVVADSAMVNAYWEVGGTPYLDGTYTVFGKVIEGLDVVDAIQQSATDEGQKPLEDVRIVRAEVE